MTTPSKKIIVAIGVLLVVLGIIFAVTRLSPKVTYLAPQVSVGTTTSLLEVDADKDGLRDWEEGLWKTDLKNPDTDGDGTPDGEEIKLKRDPLVKGPNDKLDTDTVGSKINPETEQDLTSTDKFSRELFIKIVAAGQAENPPTEADFQNFLASAIKNEVENQKARFYSSPDLTIDTEETPEKIRAYGNEIATIIKTPPPKPLEYELAIVDRAQVKKDPLELKKLAGNIASYRKIEQSLLKMTVPKSAVQFHLSFINSSSNMAWSINGLSYIMTDPLKALPGVTGYSENFQKFILSLHNFRNYFANNNTVFSTNDAGYHFFDRI